MLYSKLFINLDMLTGKLIKLSVDNPSNILLSLKLFGIFLCQIGKIYNSHAFYESGLVTVFTTFALA